MEPTRDGGRTVQFFIESDDVTVGVYGLFDTAFPAAPQVSDTLPAFMFRRLLRNAANTIDGVVRFALPRQDLPAGMAISDEDIQAAVCSVTDGGTIAERGQGSYVLQCLDDRFREVQVGDRFFMTISVVPNDGSPLHAYLRENKVVYVRFEQ